MGALQDDLLDPSALPAPHPARVELMETHISWVFLTERDVYKVKKPVGFAFLDFRTLEARKRACEAELMLNRRLSEGVYLDLIPVVRDSNGAHRLGGEGDPIDWAVHMVRLPDEHRGDVRLSKGTFGRREVRIVAERLAAFHATARCNDEISAFGSESAIARSVEENFTDGRAAIDVAVSADEERRIEEWQRSFLRNHHALFEQRIAGGRVRDGHGDLRLEHLYLDPSLELTILDCIEFNDRFRYADVAADLAFLAMDLAVHGRVDLAELLVAEYARAANDFDLYAVVDFYESYRAYVRAKIATFLATDASASDALRTRATSEARRYFLLALSAGRRSLLRPIVVAVGGLIASGKSTIAGELGAALSAPVVDADRTRKSMIGVEPTTKVHDPAWKGAYDPEFTEQVYAEVLRRAEVVLASGRPVVIDASFRSPSMRDAARELARKHGVPFRFVECRAPAEVCRARLVERERHAAVSDGRLAIFDEFCASYRPVTELDAAEHEIIDTTSAVALSLAALAKRIGSWPSGLRG